MAAVVIGALRVDLGLSTAAFTKDANAAARTAEKLGDRVKNVGKGMAIGGAAMTAGITMPFVGLLKSAIPAAIESEEAMAQVKAGLASMGPVAGKTAEDLEKLAAGLQATSSVDDDDILRDLTANMLTFGNVAGDNFDRAQQAALDMSVKMKTDLKSAGIMVGKALNDPVKGMSAMSKAGVQFTEQQKTQIKTMVKAGDVAGAQALMLGELENQFKGAAQAERDAAPGSDTVDSWREFQETIGGIALEYLPLITDNLTTLLNGFNGLSDGTKTFILAGVGVVAVLGPLLVGLGAMVGAVGALIPVLAGLGGAFTVMMGPLLPLTLAVAAVAAAWYYWDDIVAIVGRVGDAVSTWYTANVKPTVDKVLAAAGSVADFFKGLFVSDIMTGIEIVSSLLRGDFAGAFETARAFVQGRLGAIGGFFGDMVGKALGYLGNLYNGVKVWIQGRLGAVFDWLKGKLTAVGGYFFDLYDRVVGHSYVPDMVDGIAAHMGRLDKVMVDPAKRAAASTAEVMRGLAADTHALLDRLFPEIAKAQAFRRDMSLIDNSGLDAGQKREAEKRRAFEEMGEDPNAKTPVSFADVGPIVDPDAMKEAQKILDEMSDRTLPKFGKRTWEETQKVVESFADMTRNVLGSLRGMVSSFKGGDIIGGIMGLADLVSQVVGAIGSIKGLNTPQAQTGYQAPNYSTPGYGGGRALGGAVVPGKRYRIGERGPEYVSFGARGQITPDNDNGGRMQVNFNGVMTSEDFWQKIDDLDNQAAMRGSLGGAQYVQRSQQKRARSRLGRG